MEINTEKEADTKQKKQIRTLRSRNWYEAR